MENVNLNSEELWEEKNYAKLYCGKKVIQHSASSVDITSAYISLKICHLCQTLLEERVDTKDVYAEEIFT